MRALLLLAAALVPLAAASYPGLGVAVSEAAVAKLVAHAMVIPTSEAIAPAPKVKFSCAGTCYFENQGGALTSVACTAPSVSLAANAVVSTSLQCTAQLAINFRIHRSTFPSASCSGTIKSSVSGLAIAVASQAVAAPSGAVAFQAVSSHITLSSDPISVHGNTFCVEMVGNDKGTVEASIRTAFQSQSSNLTVAVNNALAKLHFPTQVAMPRGLLLPLLCGPSSLALTRAPPGLSLDMRLASAPQTIAANGALAFSFLGTWSPAPAPCPTPAAPFPAPKRAVSVAYADCASNSLAASMFQLGLLASSKPAIVPYKVQWGVGPRAHARSQSLQGALVNVTAKASSAPVITTTPSGASLAVNLTLDVANHTLLTKVDIGVEAPFTVSLSSARVLSAAIKAFTVNHLIVTNSSGTYDESHLDFFVGLALDKYLPQVNSFLGKGLTLPASTKLLNPTLSLNAGFIQIDADLQE